MAVVRNGSLALAAALLGLVILEFTLRALHGQPLWPDRNYVLERASITNRVPLVEYDPLLGWVYKSNMSAEFGAPAQPFTTGALGIRMNQSAIRPVPRQAILAVGDSFTAGVEVGDEATWPAALERMIGEPVVNGGVGAWGADQIILRTESLIPIVSPRTIIVSFLEDDILRTEFETYGGGPKPYFVVEGGWLVHRNHPVPRIIESGSYELGWMRSVLGYSYLVDRVMARLGARSWFDSKPFAKIATDPVAVSCRLLERLKQKTDAAAIRLMFVMQWSGNELAEWRSRPDFAAGVLDCAAHAGIQTVDTWDALKAVYAKGAAELKALYNMRGNGRFYSHMSPAGNELIAGILAKALRERGLTASADPASARPAMPRH